MASRNAQLADAIKVALNAVTPGAFVLPFKAVRTWVVSNPIAALQSVTVNVVAASDASERTARDTDEHRLLVYLGVQQKILADPATEAANKQLDVLVQLTEQLSDFFGVGTVPESNGFFVNSTIQVLADPARLLNDKLYLGIVHIEYLLAIAGL